MRTWWPAVVGAVCLPIAMAAIAAETSVRDVVMTLVVPAAFLTAGSAGVLLRVPPRLALQVWSVGIAHTAAVGLSALAIGTGDAVLHAASQVAYALGFGALLVVAAAYPHGHAGRGWYAVGIAAATLPVVGAFSGPSPTVIENGSLGPIVAVLPAGFAFVGGGFFALGPAAAVTFAVRYVRHPRLRRAMRWPVLGLVALACLVVTGFVVRDASESIADAVFLVAMPLLPAALMLGAATRRLPDVDQLLLRTSIVGATWLLAAAAYGVGASATAWAAGSRSLLATLLVAGLLSALLAAPIRRLLVSLAADRARLHADLERKVVELDESRRRIATAAEAERVRIERDLHDGVQQEALALMTAVEVCRARGLAETHADVLAERARGLYESVRAVAQGIRPAVLDDHGLRAAAETLARQCMVPTSVEGEDHRWAPEIEGALYFVVAEALTNVVKHSGARRARVLVGHDRVQVRDDGGGGIDPARGTGLRGLRDRLEALGGTLTITREDGWTVVTATTTGTQ